ncbi:MAG: SIMPL domain-containing protein [Pseudomonadota bacterium]
MKHLALLTAFALLLPPQIAKADNEDPIFTLPDGQAVLSISATERRDVEQDLLVATLAMTITHRDSKKVQNDINTAMKKALDIAQGAKEVKVNTGSYRVYEYTEPRTEERKWRGSQTLTLKSKNADNVLSAVQKIQELGLTVQGLNYMVDPKTAVAVTDDLLEDALQQLQTRANRAAKALGKSKAELRDINVNGGGGHYRPVKHYARAMAMESADMATPVAAAGEDTLSLTVTARAILKP